MLSSIHGLVPYTKASPVPVVNEPPFFGYKVNEDTGYFPGQYDVDFTDGDIDWWAAGGGELPSRVFIDGGPSDPITLNSAEFESFINGVMSDSLSQTSWSEGQQWGISIFSEVPGNNSFEIKLGPWFNLYDAAFNFQFGPTSSYTELTNFLSSLEDYEGWFLTVEDVAHEVTYAESTDRYTVGELLFDPGITIGGRDHVTALPSLYAFLLTEEEPTPPQPEAPTEFNTGDTVIEESSTSITLNRPFEMQGGTYYAWIMHRDTLSVPENWEIIASQDVGNQSLGQKLSVVKSTGEVLNMTFTQASAQRFLGVVLETVGGSEWQETITFNSGIDVNGWHAGAAVTPPGNGLVMSGSCSTLGNVSGATQFLSALRRVTPGDVVDNRLCVSIGNVVNGNEVTPQFYCETSDSEFAEISITLTDNADAPEEFSRTPFITEWQHTSVYDTIELPLVSTGIYDFWVDWGFGDVRKISSYTDPSTYTMGTAEFNFASKIGYQVKVYGVCDRWNFMDADTARAPFDDIIQWGDVEWATCAGMFRFCNFEVSQLTATDAPNTSNVTDFSEMFSQSDGLTVAPELDLTNALTVERMFYLSDIEETPYYNTLNCTNFNNMMRGCALSGSGFGGVNTDSALDIGDMFNDCEGLTTVTLNTSNVQEFASVFANNASIIDCGTLDIGNNSSTIFAPFQNAINLTTFRILNADSRLQLEDTAVTWATISQLWDDLPVVPGELRHEVRIQGTPAVSDPNYDPSPAIAKGWTVTDS